MNNELVPSTLKNIHREHCTNRALYGLAIMESPGPIANSVEIPGDSP